MRQASLVKHIRYNKQWWLIAVGISRLVSLSVVGITSVGGNIHWSRILGVTSVCG